MAKNSIEGLRSQYETPQSAAYNLRNTNDFMSEMFTLPVDKEVNIAISLLNSFAPVVQAGEGDVKKDGVSIENIFNPLIKKISDNSYGNKILSNMMDHPRLESLEIKEPDSWPPASVRRLMGKPPIAETEFTDDGYRTGKGVNAIIRMDASMSAEVYTYDGQSVIAGSDVVLFHELAHIYMVLNNEPDSESVATLHEGLYGGYNRDYNKSATPLW